MSMNLSSEHSPTRPKGRKIAHSFWGQAWCDHLEAHHNYENRLAPGRSYLRKGAVLDLRIETGYVTALVADELNCEVSIRIKPLEEEVWQEIVRECVGQIGSLVELIEGRLSPQVISILTAKDSGVLPTPSDVKMACTCPDYATVCVHAAAVLYGIGSKLDHAPELLFTLRSIDYRQIINAAAQELTVGHSSFDQVTSARSELEELFGIELE
jgi:uncharacterized Zn finger protein